MTPKEGMSTENLSLLITLLLVAAGMLFLAVPPMWPYGYYTLLRFVVCGTSIVGIIVLSTYMWDKTQITVMAIVAILFNPLIPVYLTKDLWSVIDVVVAAYFIVTRYRMKKWLKRYQSQSE